MHNIAQLQRKLQPIFMRHNAEKVFVTDSMDENSLNLYVVGCSRVVIPVIQEEILRVLDKNSGINMNHLESEFLMDAQIRSSGKLLYEKICA